MGWEKMSIWKTPMKSEKTYHRLGEPGGPTCPVGILPITFKGKQGEPVSAELLDAGTESSEVELLRTIASRMGIRWGHDEFGWWAVVTGRGFPSWAVWRQDDLSSKTLVDANLTEEQASSLVATFKAQDHKQTYWYSNEAIT
jgi:hypothetical protein